jgi:hypothetical protein
MTYKTDMEAAFEEWFEARRQSTWRKSRISTDPEDPSPAWSMGLRWLLREGWIAAVLWCRLCHKEHEGPCVSSAEQHSGEQK